MRELAKRAKMAAAVLGKTGIRQRNAALAAARQALLDNTQAILRANQADVECARQQGTTEVMLDRLLLNERRIRGMADGLGQLIDAPDPIGGVDNGVRSPDGLLILRRRVPLGLVGIIYESRPNVTVDAAGLCIKAGNAVLLRGGKEAIGTNKLLVGLLHGAMAAHIPADCVCLVEDTRRESAKAMMELTGLLDVLIPRGGAGLIRSVVDHARVPVIETGVGNCHTYVDQDADLEMALAIVENAKCQRPSVCNAMETLLVCQTEAAVFLPRVQKRLSGVELRGCDRTVALLGVHPATEQDWSTEFLDYILAVKVVAGLDEAVAHIARYGSGHSEAIVTRDLARARRFTEEVDAAAVYVNASTRFTDGEMFGLGAEIGIATSKLHARGPMGLSALTTIRYVVQGDGQIRV